MVLQAGTWCLNEEIKLLHQSSLSPVPQGARMLLISGRSPVLFDNYRVNPRNGGRPPTGVVLPKTRNE